MKVAYISAYAAEFPSRTANSIHVMRMCEALKLIGCEVFLYLRDRGFTKNEVMTAYGVDCEMELAFLRAKVPKLNRLFYSRKAVIDAKKGAVDLILSRSAIACWFSGRQNIPFVFDVHGPISDRNFVERWCYNRIRRSSHFKRMTFNSKAMERWYADNNLLPEKAELIVAMNGASPPKRDLRSNPVNWPGRSKKLQVGYTGHLYPGRGVDIILECAHRLKGCDFHLIGGNESDIKHWKAKCRTKNVYFHGYVNPSLVADYRDYCDVLLAPYQKSGVSVSGGMGDSSSYMNPIKVIEYMASGKAIVASDLPAIRDCLPTDGAILVEPNDINSWVKAIQRLQSDRKLYNKLCASARSGFCSELTWEGRARKLTGLVRD